MSSPNPSNRTSAAPGPRAVGFRAPRQRGGKEPSGGIGTQIQNHPAHPAPSLHVAPSLPTATSPAKPVAAAPAVSPRSAPPTKKRAKGSSFLGILFLSVVGGFGYLVWSNFLQFQSYGVIEGRLISVAAPWDGTIDSWQVRDGDLVQQGEILATLSNLTMQHELAALGDQLKMSQANLDAEMAKIKFSVQGHSERSQKATAEYLQASGELLAEQARFQELERKLERAEKLYKNKNVSKSEFEKLYFEFVGQQSKLEQLEAAVTVLKSRSNEASPASDAGTSQLKPLLAKIEQIQSEISRLRERIDQGQIKAPVSGRITQRLCLTGEAASEREPVLEILEDNSIEAILYVPQTITDEFAVGADIEIRLEPYDRPVRCTVTRLGDRFEPAPSSISRYYSTDQYLLPVHLKPHSEFNQLFAMRVQGTVKRPYQWHKTLAKGWEQMAALRGEEASSTNEFDQAE